VQQALRPLTLQAAVHALWSDLVLLGLALQGAHMALAEAWGPGQGAPVAQPEPDWLRAYA